MEQYSINWQHPPFAAALSEAAAENAVNPSRPFE